MQSLQEFHGPETILSALRYTRIRLSARADTQAWAAETEAQRQKVYAAVEAHNDAVDERAGLTAEISALDKELDASVARIARKVKDLCDGKLDDPRYLLLFRVPASDGMKPVVDDAQTQYVRTILQTINTDDAFVDIRATAKEAQQRLDALLAASEGRDAKYTAEGVANGALKAASDEARRAYNALPAKLELLFGDRQAFIDSFFRTLGKADAGA